MNQLKHIITSLLTTLFVLFVLYNFLPLSWLDALSIKREQPLGATITTIQGSDRLTDSRAVINTNFSNLNSSKAELTGGNSFSGTNSFTDFNCFVGCDFGGTATSTFSSAGVLSLITPLAHTSGGTGTTSPSLYRILLGNGDYGITIASSTGSSGQFLTSGGGGAYPSWTTAAFNEAGNYNFSGSNTFASTTLSYQNTASTTIDGRMGLGVNAIAASTSPMWYAFDQSASDDYVIQLDGFSKYTKGARVAFKPNATNTLDSTLNVNSLGAVTIKTKSGVDTRSGDLRPNNISELIYDGTNFMLQNPMVANVDIGSNLVINNDLCPNAAWTDLQIGNIVGTTTAMVFLRVQLITGNTAYASFRPNGSTASTSSGTGFATSSSIALDTLDGTVLVKTDSSGIVEWRCGKHTASAPTFNLTVEGWWNI